MCAVKLNRLKNLSHKSFLKPGIGVHCATIFDQKYRHSGSKAAKAQKVFLCSLHKGFGRSHPDPTQVKL